MECSLILEAKHFCCQWIILLKKSFQREDGLKGEAWLWEPDLVRD